MIPEQKAILERANRPAVTDAEKLQRAIDHILICHDVMDTITVDFAGAFTRQNDGSFVLGAHDWMNLHCLINSSFPRRPSIPEEYLEKSNAE